MPFGQRRQICCEQVEITASDAALADLPSVVLPLAVADLPLILWCRSPRLFDLPEFRAVGGHGRPCGGGFGRFLRPAGGPPAAGGGSGASSGPPVGDLAWTHLTRWREMLVAGLREPPEPGAAVPERSRFAWATAAP